jgi:hypothetical protein
VVGRPAGLQNGRVPDSPTITGIAHVIQLAIAPVFLLSAIAGMLAVMTNRLARIVDRARAHEARIAEAGAAAAAAATGDLPGEDLESLSRRARLIGRAIFLCTTTALLVCAVIVLLFLGAILEFDPSKAAALLFVAAMSAFFFGLLSFLREVLLATVSLRIGGLHVETQRLPFRERRR